MPNILESNLAIDVMWPFLLRPSMEATPRMLSVNIEYCIDTFSFSLWLLVFLKSPLLRKPSTMASVLPLPAEGTNTIGTKDGSTEIPLSSPGSIGFPSPSVCIPVVVAMSAIPSRISTCGNLGKIMAERAKFARFFFLSVSRTV